MNNIKNNILAASALLACATLPGCRDSGNDDSSYFGSFVTQYFLADSISIRPDKKHGDTFLVGSYRYHIYRHDETRPARRRVYDNLCTKHGDAFYDRWEGPGFSNRALGHDWASIELASDADYAEGYPAGSSLSPLAGFEGVTYGPYIRSGYTLSPTLVRYPVNAMLDELRPTDMTLLGIREQAVYKDSWEGENLYEDWYAFCYFARLRLLSPPTLSQTHNFTLTLTNDEGRAFTADFRAVFDGPDE